MAVALAFGGADASWAATGKSLAGEPPAKDWEKILRVQIFLDSQRFCPGTIDGRSGEFTRKAIAAWNEAGGRGDAGWSAVLEAAGREVQTPFGVCVLNESNVSSLTPDVPTKPDDQAGLKHLGYRDVGEFLAERFHTSPAFLKRLNPGVRLDRMRPGDRVKVPNVDPFLIEELETGRTWSAESGLSARSITVDTGDRSARVHNSDGKLCAFFPITPGAEKFVPRGEWKIEVMLALPRFRWDRQMLEHGTRGSEALDLPPGPNSPVGVLWAGLDREGIGLHGTAEPETIGRSQSAGCIRFANWDAVRLPLLVRPGSRVTVK